MKGKKADELKAKVLQYIDDQIGLRLESCDSFTKVKVYRSKDIVSFYALIDTYVSESKDFLYLQRFLSRSQVIADVQPSGVKRISVSCYKDAVMSL
nr:hypothetical protein [uncultured Mediterranean phage uvMED]